MNTLNEFISNVKAGMAKPQFFAVQLTLPDALDRVFRSHMRKIILFCDQTQIPGVSFSTSQVRSYGEFKEVPYEKLFEPVNLSFYVDSDMIVKKLFDTWAELVQDPTTRDFNYPKYYMSKMVDIIVSDAKDNQKYKVTLHDVFPKAIAPIQLDYASKDIMKVSVTLSYKYATTVLLQSTTSNEQSFSAATQMMPNYAYGYTGITQVPLDYFSDFSGFQSLNAFNDFSLGGVKSLTTNENVGEITGFGGIFT